MRMKQWNRRLAWILSMVMLLTLAMPVTAAPAEDIQVVTADSIPDISENAAVEEPEIPEEEPPYAYHDVVRVSILLEEKSTIAAGYEIAGIGTNSEAMAYRDALDASLDAMTQRIEKTIGCELDVVWKLSLAANLISANIPYGRVEQIRGIPGVAQVVIENQYVPAVVSKDQVANPNMGTSGAQTGSYTAWAAGYTGAGSRIAIIDTGLDVLHEAFAADAFAYSLAQLENTPELMEAADIASVLQQLNVLDRMEVSAEELYVNGKVPFGFNYVDGDLDVSHYKSEHGSHVAGIAAANAYVKREDAFVPALSNTCVQGMAPDAQLLVMKVFGTSGGAYDSDYMAAIEDAILLGADAVNLSLGSSAPGFTGNTVYQDLLDGLSGSGVVVTMSAGNNGAWADHMDHQLRLEDVSFHTAGAPGTYTNSLSVASVDNDGITDYAFLVNGQVHCYRSPSGTRVPNLTEIPGEHEYVFISGTATIEQVQAHSDLFAGRIAVYIHGANNQIWIQPLLALEPIGIVVCGSTSAYPNVYNGQSTQKPIVTCTGNAANALRENAQAVEGTPFYVGKLTALPGWAGEQFHSDYYTMSAFSSWGVPGSLELKPEITAPGGNIFSVAGYVEDYIDSHTAYEVMSGTSMAAPQIAGMVALLTQYFRENSLVERTGLDARVLAQSLLMSTAVPILDSTNQYYYPVIQQGAGLANVGEAILADSYILMHSDATASWADGKIKAELGDDPERAGVYTFTFDIHNLADGDRTFTLRGDIFTQGMDIPNGYTLKTTEMLTPDITWKLNGAPLVSTGDERPDINGDGVVNGKDGRAILEYTVGNLQLEDLDLADLDGNGTVNTYDAYLFFTMYSGAEVPVAAGETVQVEVTVTLSADDREKLAKDPNGTFIQGYIFAESEGGTSHSIPVLGYYGGWSEPSMFDPATHPNQDKEENKERYLDIIGNYIRLFRPWESTNNKKAYLGINQGNVTQYQPERNAISAKTGEWIHTVSFVLIRDAAAGVYFVRNSDTGEFLETEYLGALNAMHYNPTTGKIDSISHTVLPYFVPEDIPEGTNLEIGVAAFTEYHVNQGYTLEDLDKLGEGAVFSMPVVVDNTAPVLESWELSEDKLTLTVTVSDDRYVNAVCLLGYDMDEFARIYASTEQTPGGATTYTFDLTGVDRSGFFIKVLDDASNSVQIFIDEDLGEVVDRLAGVGLNQYTMILDRGETGQLRAHADFKHSTLREFIWESSDPSVATVDRNGLVTAKSPGVAYIYARSTYNTAYSATCAVTVVSRNVRIKGVLADEQGTTKLFSWQMDQQNTWTGGNALDFPVISATRDSRSGNVLVMNGNTLQVSSLDANTGNVKKTGVNNMGLPLWDMAYSQYFSTSTTPRIHGIYGNYFLPALDAFDLQPMAFQLNYTAVGIASLGYEQKTYSGQKYETEHVILLTSTGGLRHFWVYKTADGSYGALTSSKTTNLQDLGVEFTLKNGFSNVSMIADESGGLYVSILLGSRAVLYRILATKDRRGNDTNLAEAVASFGKGVYPAVLTSITVDGVTADAMQSPEPDSMAVLGTLETEKSAAAPKASRSSIKVASNQPQMLTAYKTFTLSVTPKDLNGSSVNSTNGLITVTYDPEKLELVDIQTTARYCVVNDSVPGAVTLAYVHPEGIREGAPIAELEFSNKNMVNTSVKVIHKEWGDQVYSYEETVKVRGPVEWVQATTSLEGNIGLNFYVSLADEIAGDPTAFVRFTYADTIVDVPIQVLIPLSAEGDSHVQGEPRRFTCPISAKNMTDVVTAQVINAEGPVGDRVALSVATYCYYMITHSQDAELVSLMKAMLNYGAAAQVLFDHNTDNLANASLSEADKILADVDASAYAHAVTGSEEGIQVYNATLLLETETSIRIYFKLTGSKTINQFTFQVNGQVVQAKANGELYYVEIPNIAAQHLDQMHTVTVGGLTIRYGGLSYVNQVIKNPQYATEAMTNAAKALFAYNKMAENYFN